MNPIFTQRKEIDAFARLNPMGMRRAPEAARKEKPAEIASTITSAPTDDIENANCCAGDGRMEPERIYAPEQPPAGCSLPLTEDEADSLDDRLLWEFLGDPTAAKLKRAAYKRMNQRRDKRLLNKRFSSWR